jgi:hypothetical protein
MDTRRRERDAALVAGSCLCSAVAFSTAALPQRVVNCYCSLCRRRTGAAFKSTFFAAANDFRWLRGQEKVRHYALPAPRAYRADFCVDCGSPVPRLLGQQATAMLPAGAIDTELPPLPALHIYVASKAPWYEITDAWPQFAELPPPEQLKEYFR